MSRKKRYVLIGTGIRGLFMFGRPLVNDYPDTAELVGVMDANPLRAKAALKMLGVDLPVFTDFDAMIAALSPDGVCVATMDSTHAEYVVRSLKAGCRVYCEKPLCINAAQLREIRDAAASSKALGFVTHNARYNAGRWKLRECIQAGMVGEVQHMEFVENLDLFHGASYFRRWHRHKRNSGGLLIHKASHHFDVLNWLVSGSKPRTLRAVGGTYFYGKAGPFRGERCSTCAHTKECAFYEDISADENLNTLYGSGGKGPESVDGYHRDGCVFDPSIDAEDHLSVLYDYDNGVRVNYTLSAYSHWEGDTIFVQGSTGRLEYTQIHMHNARTDDNGQQTGPIHKQQLLHYDFWKGTCVEIPVPPPRPGGHGGADPALRDHLFRLDWDAPRPDSMAPLDEGMQAVLVGVAANESIARGGEEIDVQSLLNG